MVAVTCDKDNLSDSLYFHPRYLNRNLWAVYSIQPVSFLFCRQILSCLAYLLDSLLCKNQASIFGAQPMILLRFYHMAIESSSSPLSTCSAISNQLRDEGEWIFC